MGSVYGIWDKKKEKVWESRRVHKKDEKDIWESRGSTKKKLGRDEEIY